MIQPAQFDNPTDDARSYRYVSPGVNAVLSTLDRNNKNNILDLGTMNQNNVAFFSNHSCKLFVEHIAPSLKAINNGSDIDDYLLNYGDTTQFDAILTWDIFNYLDLTQLARLISRIKKNCKTDTLLHAIIYTDESIAEVPRSFGLWADKSLQVSQSPDQVRTYPQYNAFDLLSHLPQFVAQDSWTNTEGMLPGTVEYTFRLNPEPRQRIAAIDNTPKQDVVKPKTRSADSLVHKSPGLEKVSRYLKALEKKPRILDLGNDVHFEGSALPINRGEVIRRNVVAPISTDRQRELDADMPLSLCPDTLKFDSEEPFDLILVWDIFNYLPLIQITVLAEKLRGVCREGTQLHALMHTQKTMPESPRQFTVGDDYSLQYEDPPNSRHNTQAFTTLDLLKRMRGFKIGKTLLLQEGMHSGISELIISFKG